MSKVSASHTLANTKKRVKTVTKRFESYPIFLYLTLENPNHENRTRKKRQNKKLPDILFPTWPAYFFVCMNLVYIKLIRGRTLEIS